MLEQVLYRSSRLRRQVALQKPEQIRRFLDDEFFDDSFLLTVSRLLRISRVALLPAALIFGIFVSPVTADVVRRICAARLCEMTLQNIIQNAIHRIDARPLLGDP